MGGLDFAEVFADRVMVQNNEGEVPVMSKPHLLRAKNLAREDPRRSSQAAIDAEDLDILTRLDVASRQSMDDKILDNSLTAKFNEASSRLTKHRLQWE